MQRWFDGHLDMAFLEQQGRDLAKGVKDCGGLLQPAAVTFPSLAAGKVRAALATIFIQRRMSVEEARRQGDEDEAWKGETPWCFDTLREAGEVARKQLAIYQRWEREGRIELVSRGAKPKTGKIKQSLGEPLKVVILMEGAMGMERVEEFDEFYEGGVRVVSLTWAEGSVWSGGDHFGGDVTGMGRELIRRMDELGVVHDVSHLSERAFWTVMEVGKGMKVASHSNCRALLPGKKYPERHLSDEQIRALVKGGGIIGINLYAGFLVAEKGGTGVPVRARLADVMGHIRHMEEVAGRRDFLALGSDMDGGFSRANLPADMDGPEHLGRLAEALSGAGWSDGEIERFAWGNWVRVLGTVGVEF